MQISQKVNNITIEGEDTSKKATINTNKIAKLQYILTRGLYSDPVSAVISEWVNNAVDSVIQSGKDPIQHPVIVKLDRNNFSVQDKGTGLNKEEFENVCMNYLTSTKEEDDDAIGHFGLGMKSFLALNKTASFTCRKDGKEWKFIAYEGTEFMEYEMLYEKDTTEENGVTCEIAINEYSEFYDFSKKIKSRLAYYDTVILYIDGHLTSNQIIRSDDWQYSDNQSQSEMIICLKDVPYSINWEKIGHNKIYFPIALRFDLKTCITPTPSRESIIYTAETITLIREKIKVVADWFVNKYNSEWKEYETFKEAYNFINLQSKNIKVGEKIFDVVKIEQYSNVKCKDLKISYLKEKSPKVYYDMSGKFFNNYSLVGYKDYYGLNTRIKYESIKKFLFQDYTPILVNKVPVGNFRKYLLDKYSDKQVLFIKKIQDRKLGDRKLTNSSHWDTCYLNVCNLVMERNKSKWRSIISEFQKVEGEYLQNIQDETSEFIPEAWLLAEKELRKKQRESGGYSSSYKSLNKQEGDMTITYCLSNIYNRYRFEKSVVKPSNLHKNNYLTVYFESDNSEEQKIAVRKYAELLGNKHNVKVAIIGKREIKKLPNIHNFKSITNFMSRETKPFVRIVTAEIASNTLNKYQDLAKSTILSNVLPNVVDKIDTLRKYVNANKVDKVDSGLLDSILLFAKENNIYDLEIMSIINEIESKIKDLEFITLLKKPDYWNDIEREKYKRFVYQMLLFKKLYNPEILEQFDVVKKESPVAEVAVAQVAEVEELEF